MYRLRRWSVVTFVFALAPVLQAQDKPPSQWAVDRSLTVTPQGPPVPLLKYRLLPLSSELKAGNAVPIYLRLVHEQSDASRKYWFETPLPWNELPVDKIPLDEANTFLERNRSRLRQIEIGARRRTADWEYTLDEGNPIGLLLPDVQWMRNYAPMLILQARVALAKGDFPAAVHHLETGFAFSRHIASGPSLIHRLIGVALSTKFASAAADFIERPGAPNLYWALTTLPRPLIDLREAAEWEYRMLEMQFPDLAGLDREQTPEQWDATLRRYRTEVRNIASEGSGGKRKLPDWFPKAYAPDEPAARSPDLPAARRFVARTKGLSADQVEALPAAQVLLRYIVGAYTESRDEIFRLYYLPPARAVPLIEATKNHLREPPRTEGQVAARLLLPGVSAVVLAQTRLERNLAALRAVEALRIYAAGHDGRLPDKLADVTEVPIPADPGTGKPFEYTLEGDTATVTAAPIPGAAAAGGGIRYRVTLRKK